MQAENMKLLDLEIGKYLELGKYWLYGGNYIIIYPQTYIFSKDFDIVSLSEPQEPLKTLCEKTGAVVYGERYVLLNGFKVPESNKYDKDHYFIGDVASVCVNAYDKADEYRLMILASCESVLLRWYEIHKFKKQGHFCITSEIDTDYSDWFENIFEEYSKQLRNEPNKFDELKEHFK